LPSLSTGIRHPKEALLYVLLGKDGYARLRNPSSHTCHEAKELSLPFAAEALRDTDIHEHLVTLYMLTVELRLKTVVELGTRTGESTVALLFAAKECSGEVFSYDINDCPDAKRAVERYGLQGHWHFNRSDDLKVDWNGPIDHLYVDTSHTYDQTLRELQKFEPHVNHNGIITMHDPIAFPAVRAAATTYMKGRDDMRLYEYTNNNGLLVIFKK
jgi:predicted O-methyltransferase YrrM